MNAFKKFEAKKLQNKAIQFLGQIREELGLNAPVETTVKISSRCPVQPLGASNGAFPAGYFDSFNG